MFSIYTWIIQSVAQHLSFKWVSSLSNIYSLSELGGRISSKLSTRRSYFRKFPKMYTLNLWFRRIYIQKKRAIFRNSSEILHGTWVNCLLLSLLGFWAWPPRVSSRPIFFAFSVWTKAYILLDGSACVFIPREDSAARKNKVKSFNITTIIFSLCSRMKAALSNSFSRYN